MLLLAGCDSKPAIEVRTETVEKPVYVALPANLTQGIEAAPVPDRLTNDGLLGVAEGEKCRRILANCQLERIEGLQPGGARRPSLWCVKYEAICKGSP